MYCMCVFKCVCLGEGGWGINLCMAFFQLPSNDFVYQSKPIWLTKLITSKFSDCQNLIHEILE